MNRRIEKSHIVKLVISFILATIILSLIFIVVNSIAYLDYINSNKQTNIISSTINYMEQKGQNINCSNDFFQSTSQKLDFIAKSMNLLETQWGTDDPRVLKEKELYSQLEESHLNVILELNKKCNSNFLPILFFYSNKKSLIDKSQKVSFILSSFRQSHLGKVLVYSFDYDLNSSTITELKQKYNVTIVPSIVIGKTWTMLTIENINELYIYLNQ